MTTPAPLVFGPTDNMGMTRVIIYRAVFSPEENIHIYMYRPSSFRPPQIIVVSI
jgi:hypothetical protein